MIKSKFALRAVLALALVALAACSSKPEGTYYADFSSSTDPNVALAAALMKLSLTFEGDEVTMQIDALGNSEKVDVDAKYNGDTITLTKPGDPKEEEMILTVKDGETLECEQCPDGMPSVWKKKQQ